MIPRLMGPEKMYREFFLGHNSRRSMEPSSLGKRRFAAEKLNGPLLMLCWLAVWEAIVRVTTWPLLGWPPPGLSLLVWPRSPFCNIGFDAVDKA